MVQNRKTESKDWRKVGPYLPRDESLIDYITPAELCVHFA